MLLLELVCSQLSKIGSSRNELEAAKCLHDFLGQKSARVWNEIRCVSLAN